MNAFQPNNFSLNHVLVKVCSICVYLVLNVRWLRAGVNLFPTVSVIEALGGKCFLRAFIFSFSVFFCLTCLTWLLHQFKKQSTLVFLIYNIVFSFHCIFACILQVEQCLRNFDLSEYRRVLSDIAIWIYQVRLFQLKIQHSLQ